MRAAVTLTGALLLLGCAGSPPPQPAHAAAAAPEAAAAPAPTPPVAAEHVHPLEDAFDEPEPVRPEHAEAPTVPAPELGPRPPDVHPLAQLTTEALAKMLVEDRAALGPISVGRPSGGRLLNAVQLPDDPKLYERVDPAHEWATQETIDYLRHAIERVHEQFPDTPPLHVGHISAQHGGPLSPHRSHQSGRDVDISYFYSKGARWYRRGTRDNLDLARNWAFVKALVTETDVDLIIIDHSIQRLLREHALSIGEDADWVEGIFSGRRRGRRGLVVHAKGHATHIHIRFFSPVAQETARRIYPALIEHDIIEPPTYFVSHRVRKGDTLGKLARRYGTTVKAIMRANGLRNTVIRAKHVYKIPKAGPVKYPQQKPLQLPPRYLPPTAGENDTKRLDAAALGGPRSG